MLRLFFSLFAPLRLCGKHSYKNKNLRNYYAENTEAPQRRNLVPARIPCGRRINEFSEES